MDYKIIDILLFHLSDCDKFGSQERVLTAAFSNSRILLKTSSTELLFGEISATYKDFYYTFFTD